MVETIWWGVLGLIGISIGAIFIMIIIAIIKTIIDMISD